MKVIRRAVQHHSVSETRPESPRETYYFYEKKTGVAHFHVGSDADGRLPVEQAAGLLAMHCMVRGQSPSDYVVMVQAEADQLSSLRDKAEKLLEAGRSVKSPVKLTRREEEVLNGVMKSLANKEIASSLNLSERTVKFHVSSLLSKFRVRGRMELVREAARFSGHQQQVPLAPATRETRPFSSRIPTYERTMQRANVVSLDKQQFAN